MSTLRAQDRLQPALLDRLTDDDPTSAVEAVDARVINRNRLRELVLRDLAWLFNTSSPAHLDFTGAEHARHSVLNYGLPPLSGQSLSAIDPVLLQTRVRDAILEHEPRILRDTLQVEAIVLSEQVDHHNQLSLRISGQMWAQPVPLELLLHTDVDLETGRVAVREVDR